MYFSSCYSETRCNYFFGIIDFSKKLISFFDIPDLISAISDVLFRQLRLLLCVLKNLNLLVS